MTSAARDWSLLVRLLGALALAAALGLAAGRAAGACEDQPPPAASTAGSGLPWASGAKFGSCLASSGRPLDANHTFLGHQDFAAMERQSASDWAVANAVAAPLWVVSVPLLTDDTKGRLDACAAGAFDASWERIGANLRRMAGPDRPVIVRLGWEANIGSAAHPWGVDGPEQVPAYKACWRRAAVAVKAGGPGILAEWTNAKRTRNPDLRVLDMYPGDDVVDVWGVHYYDSGPRKSTQELWDRFYGATFNGGPWGLGSWLAEAKAHGKRLAVGEWGVWRQPGEAAEAADDPVYVASMARFFRENAADLAYETYLNSQDVHELCPATLFPRSAERYRTDWGPPGTAQPPS